MAESFVTIASFVASTRAPKAIVTVKTAGIATGIAEIVKMSAKIKRSKSGSPFCTPCHIIIAIKKIVIMIK